jgi:hypothetical protein
VTGGAGGPAVSQAWSALINGPGFFLDLGKARLLVNSSRQPGVPACRARSMMPNSPEIVAILMLPSGPGRRFRRDWITAA